MYFKKKKRKRICLQCRRPGFNPWVGKIPWRRAQQPTPVFLPGESHGQRSLVGCGPCGHKELDTTESLSMRIRVTRDDHSGTGEVDLLKSNQMQDFVLVIWQLDLNLHTVDSL